MTFQFFVPLARLNSRVMMLFQESTLFQKHFYLWWEGRDVRAVLISIFFSSVNTILIWAPRKISAQFHYTYSSWIEKKMAKTIDCFWEKSFFFTIMVCGCVAILPSTILSALKFQPSLPSFHYHLLPVSDVFGQFAAYRQMCRIKCWKYELAKLSTFAWWISAWRKQIQLRNEN